MTSLTLKQTINGYSKSLLNTETDGEKVVKIINDLHEIFKETLGITFEEANIQRSAAIGSKFGKALGFNYAAHCLVDYNRTQQLLKGITSAIAQKQRENPNETIKIFYAGCGPCAPFMSLVAPLYEPSDVQFTLLDINEESIKFAEILAQKLELTEYIEGYFHGDAITAEVPKVDEYHILFSETLDSLLRREAYVPIICNLLPQFTKDVILIPENVQLKMSFVCFDEKEVRTEISNQIIFDSRKAVEESQKLGLIPNTFEPVKVPVKQNKNIDGIILDTEIIVFDSIKISRAESAITLPLEFGLDTPDKIKNVVFEYQLVPEVQMYTSLELIED
jgi:predicted RNA methylase